MWHLDYHSLQLELGTMQWHLSRRSGYQGVKNYKLFLSLSSTWAEWISEIRVVIRKCHWLSRSHGIALVKKHPRLIHRNLTGKIFTVNRTTCKQIRASIKSKFFPFNSRDLSTENSSWSMPSSKRKATLALIWIGHDFIIIAVSALEWHSVSASRKKPCSKSQIWLLLARPLSS